MTRKYHNFTTTELHNINEMLNRINNIIGMDKLNNICKFFMNFHKELNKIPTITPDHYFYIHIDNPFNYDYLGSSKSQKQVESGNYAYAPLIEDNEKITCIGVSDNTGKIWLIGVYNNSNPSYIEYRPLQKYYSKRKNGFYTRKAGWYFVNPDKEYYKINPDGTPTNTKLHGCDVPIKNVSVYDIQNIKEELAMYDTEIEKQEKERHDRYNKKQEEIRLRTEQRKREEEQRRKEMEEEQRIEAEFQNTIKGYKNIGQISPGYNSILPEYKNVVDNMHMNKDDWRSFNDYVYSLGNHRGTTYSNTYVNDKLKIYWNEIGDSSD